MSGKRYTKEFKIKAVKQITDRGYKIGEVANITKSGFLLPQIKNNISFVLSKCSLHLLVLCNLVF